MKLTLEVVSTNGSVMGAERRKVFGPEGGRIGRSPEGEWVLPSPQKYVSRHHATVFSNEGGFYIQAEGGKPVGVNNPKSLLPANSPHLIRNGDHIYIDEYEILATVAAAPPLDELFSGSMRATPEPFQVTPMPLETGGLEGESVDPLDFLGGSVSTNKMPPMPPMSPLPPPSAIQDAMVFPPMPPVEMTAPARPGTLPLNWNDTTFSAPEVRPVERPGERSAEKLETEPMPQSRPMRAPPLRAPPAPEAPRPARPSPGRPDIRRVPPISPTAASPAPPLVAPSPTAPRSPALPSAAAPAVAARRPDPRPAPVAAAGAGFDLAALLLAAGVDPATVPPETAEVFGQILRIAVQGTIDTLRARDEIKAQFRLPVTRVRQSDNNPLSFVVDADEAINLLLSRRNPAYLSPVEAFQRAYDDIRAHQVALLVGMRAGVESLLNQLDPKELAEDFEKQAKRGRLLGASPRSKFWDLYEAHFEQLRGDRDDAFRRLFGEEFAQAYQQQIDALKAKRSGKGV